MRRPPHISALIAAPIGEPLGLDWNPFLLNTLLKRFELTKGTTIRGHMLALNCQSVCCLYNFSLTTSTALYQDLVQTYEEHYLARNYSPTKRDQRRYDLSKLCMILRASLLKP